MEYNGDYINAGYGAFTFEDPLSEDENEDIHHAVEYSILESNSAEMYFAELLENSRSITDAVAAWEYPVKTTTTLHPVRVRVGIRLVDMTKNHNINKREESRSVVYEGLTELWPEN